MPVVPDVYCVAGATGLIAEEEPAMLWRILFGRTQSLGAKEIMDEYIYPAGALVLSDQ